MPVETESRRALRELIELLTEIDARWAGPEWNLTSEADVVGAHRALMHLLEGGLHTMFEGDPEHPQFRRIVSPTRKFTGDNPDAIYYDAPIRGDRAYLVRGRMDGAVYVSLTLEVGTEDGSMGRRTAGVINDTQFDVDAEGRFEIRIGGQPKNRGWLALDPEASRVTTRHYYEGARPAAADPRRALELEIRALDPGPATAAPDDDSVAAGIRRTVQFVRSRTLEQAPMADAKLPPFVSIVPNQFPTPVTPGDFGLAAFDAAYSMAPYLIGPEQALVLRGRWPECRCANVCLWTRQQQTYDYAQRPVYLNRSQTRLEPDGSFRMLLCAHDPGLPNWIDTEGRPLGLVFWRFMLPEGEIETPTAELVSLDSLASEVGRTQSDG